MQDILLEISTGHRRKIHSEMKPWVCMRSPSDEWMDGWGDE